MDPTIVIFGIRAIVRLGREGSAAFNQYERDRPALFPDAIQADYRQVDFIRDTFFPDYAQRLGEEPLAKYWRGMGPAPDVPGAMEALYMAAVQLQAQLKARQRDILPERGVEVGGALMIKQWADGKGPVGPLGRLVLSMADVALEFVGANPSVVGVGGNGEKLIGALAANLSDMIPDDGDRFGPKSQFAERLVGAVLRAGLTTFTERPDLLVGAPQLQQLIQATLPPVIKAMPQDLGEQSQWRDVAEALMGPAARAALTTVAAAPTAYLGSAFDPGTAIGALTRALLEQAGQAGLKEQFSAAGFIALYRAALGVAVERPALFLGQPGKATEQIASDLFSGVAAALRDAPPPFNKDLGAHLAAAALEALQENGVAFLGGRAAWDTVLPQVAMHVVDGLSAGVAQHDMGPIEDLLSPQQLLEFGRVFVIQAARTPQMLAGDGAELRAIVRGVAQAMAGDTNLLLLPRDWLRIAAVAAEEAAANPHRLFTRENGATVGALIEDLLSVAAAELAAGGRGAGGVLFGATLREAVIQLLRAAAGNVKAAVDNQAALKDVAAKLSALVGGRSERYGGKEWLRLYRALLGRVLQGEAIGSLTDQQIEQLLAGGTRA